VASSTCAAPCTVIVPCTNLVAGMGEPEETVVGLGTMPFIEGAGDAGPSYTAVIEARAMVDGEARCTGLVTSTRDSSSAETEGWLGGDAVAPRPASHASNGVDAGGSRKSSVVSCPSGYRKQKGNTVSSKMT
jgi:hypothetical protein